MQTPLLILVVAVAAILLIWLGYPLLMWAIAAALGRPLVPDRTAGASRTVSVVLATRDRADVVRARVENLLATAHPADRIEVVVTLDAAGSQSTVESLSGIDSRVVVVEGDAPGGKAAALNAGVRAARGDVLVLADAAQRFDARTIPELVAALEDPRFAAVSGALTLGGDGRSPVHYYWAMEKWLRWNEARVRSAIGVTGAVYATRRATWPVIPPGTLLDDVYVPMALALQGHRVGFTYDARATDVRAFDAGAEQGRKTRTLTGVLQLRELLPGLMSPSGNPVWAQFVAHKLLRLLTPYLALVALGAGTIVALGWLASATPIVAVTAVGLLLLPLLIPGVRRRLFATVRWGVAMQSAAARATVNGARSRWEVWGR